MHDKLSIGLLVVVIIASVGWYLWYQQPATTTITVPVTTSVTSVQKSQTPVPQDNATKTVQSTVATATPKVLPKPETKPATHTSSTVADYSGMHIMPDGKVMTKQGTVVPDAVIRADGKIVLKDGTVVTPIIDMRSN